MGLVLDAGIENELRLRHLQVVDATRASLGLPVVEYIVTDTPLQVSTILTESSSTSKTICTLLSGWLYMNFQQLEHMTRLQVEKWVDPKSGQSTGRLKRPDSLLRAVQTLVDQSNVNAIAVVGRFPDDDIEDTDDYRRGMVPC